MAPLWTPLRSISESNRSPNWWLAQFLIEISIRNFPPVTAKLLRLFLLCKAEFHTVACQSIITIAKGRGRGAAGGGRKWACCWTSAKLDEPNKNRAWQFGQHFLWNYFPFPFHEFATGPPVVSNQINTNWRVAKREHSSKYSHLHTNKRIKFHSANERKKWAYFPNIHYEWRSIFGHADTHTSTSLSRSCFIWSWLSH